MNLNKASTILRDFNISVIRTNDAAGVWQTTPANASQMLRRLADNGQILRLARGIWLVNKSVNAWSLHSYITDPAPSYLSLQVALFHHGMIEQIPTNIHVLTTSKTRTVRTDIGTFKIHQVAPDFFCGFSLLDDGVIQMASAEKAIVDFAYFSQTKSLEFRKLPELEIPKAFSIKKARSFVMLIKSESRRNMVFDKLTSFGLKMK